MTQKILDTSFTHLITGQETKVPLLNGTYHRYINLDNASSTPSFISVQKTINKFLEFYSSVHRGSGFKSQLSTHAYNQARKIVMDFLNASGETHVCIFVKNTTEAINALAHRFPFDEDRPIVVTSGMEHHSNDLPWRAVCQVVHVGLTPNGQLNLKEFNEIIDHYYERIGLIAISGGSNVTGFINPIHDLARKAHAAGAQIAVDCAQLAAHRKIDMLPLDDPAHLDYVTISAHKMYAPYGTGALVGRRDTFDRGIPNQVGGGTVEIVTLDKVEWTEPPEKFEPGSPNVIGAIALVAAIKQLERVGLEAIAQHEADLTAYALHRLSEIPGIHIYGDSNLDTAQTRLGVIPFSMDQISHFLIAAILACEFGIAVRSGCFCAHPYIMHLMDIPPKKFQSIQKRILAGNKTDMPGMVRASFGLYNIKEDVDIFAEALQTISKGNYQGNYIQDVASGEFTPQGWGYDFNKYFPVDNL